MKLFAVLFFLEALVTLHIGQSSGLILTKPRGPISPRDDPCTGDCTAYRDQLLSSSTMSRSLVKRGFFDDLAEKAKKAVKNTKQFYEALPQGTKKMLKDGTKMAVKGMKDRRNKGKKRGRREATNEDRILVKRGFFDDLAEKAKKAVKNTKQFYEALPQSTKKVLKDGTKMAVKGMKDRRNKGKRPGRREATNADRSLVKRGFFDDLAEKVKKAAEKTKDAAKSLKEKVKDAVVGGVEKIKNKLKGTGQGEELAIPN